jgi:murein endopeptidase
VSGQRFSWRITGALTALAVVMTVLAVTVLAGADDGERRPRDPGPTPIAHPSQNQTTVSEGATSSHKQPPDAPAPIRWRRSKAIGEPWAGRLVRGVRLPSSGRNFFTWNPVRNVIPNPSYRRFGTARLIRLTLAILRAHVKEHPDAPRVGIGDLSRRRGGNFGRRFGPPGHESHQNGLDIDIYYPRRDRREVEPKRPTQIDRDLAQDLVDRFVAAGARFVFVGPNTKLKGPPDVVQPLAHHDNHMHVRIPNESSSRGN